MKNYGKMFLTVLLSVVMVFAMSVSTFAADGTYKVRVFSGDSGKFDDGLSQVHSDEVEYDGTAYISINVLCDDKYYVKGVKEAGKDTKEGYSVENGGTFSVKVKKDQDYVVDYGAKDVAKAYTVNFFDNNGNALAPSETHYGDAGDVVIVSSKYIDGYIPAALNLKKTLSADEDTNVFTFYYGKGSYNNGEETVIVREGNNGAGNNTNGADGTVNNTETQVPREMVNLDEEEAPLANVDLEKESGMSTMAIAGICGGALVLIAGSLWMILRRKREEKDYE